MCLSLLKMTLKVMLVGGFGFIGTRFIRKYHKKYELVIFGKRSSYQKFIKKNRYSDISFEIGDVTKNVYEAISLHKPDIVIHMAALTGITKCNQDPPKAFLVNMLGTYNVIKGCITNNSKLIFLSSREVYGDTKNNRALEDDPLMPNNEYGITKMLDEELVKFANRLYGLRFTILRLTTVYGPGGDDFGSQIIIKDALKGKVNVLGGNHRLNYVFVDDVVKIIAKTIQESRSNNEVFNVGSPNNLSLKEFVELVLQQIKNDVKVDYKPMRRGEVMNFTPDLKKLQSYLRINRFKEIKSGIRETIAWYSN